MTITSREQLIDFTQSGNKTKYLLFWGHQKLKEGLSSSCFSQWYESSFEVNGESYPTAEHYMMTAKARLFGDDNIAQKILATKNPGQAKKLGRRVKNFNNEVWEHHRFKIVIDANSLKFGQNSALRQFLLESGERILVEASPVDAIWGIGMAADNSGSQNPKLWKGLNLLGFALMQVRSQFMKTVD
ncbi:Uncharacterized protein COG3236 [hydrothermal vent metagenome]|uniref:Uncharacterized protein COG3236 n=1 Tax=hydrothermal vent metagenome TaxID=652676 RepID=A0A3B0YIN8_9ZZZZ